jgi:hypothetical protein
MWHTCSKGCAGTAATANIIDLNEFAESVALVICIKEKITG